jgi:HSP20 family protein
MAQRDWLPSLWNDKREGEEYPFLSLRKQMDSIFDDFLGRGSTGGSGALAVRSNVSETDKEIRLTAELPGMDQKDIDISVTGNRLTIRGEKKSETEQRSGEEGRQFHRIERSSGMFQRSIALPFDIDTNTVSAEYQNGILTVSVPKPQEVVANTKKIEVKQIR